MSCDITLKEKRLKLTPQRRVILEAIHESTAHLTAEGIITYVQARMPGINKSTVYRTLDILEEAGCVYKSGLGGQFIYHHAEEGHHHHLICIRCGRTVDCAEDLFAPVERSVRKKYGFRADFKHIVISGLCDKCKSEAS